MDVAPLTRQACLGLLARRDTAHVAYTDRALPAIRPFRYAMVGQQLVLRVPSDDLAGRLDGQVLALSVDEGPWTVVVTGAAHLLRSSACVGLSAVSVACEDVRSSLPFAATGQLTAP